MRRFRRLRHDLPFQRVALILSGGGALGAYEVGVLRVLETIGLKPAILAGVSVGAVNGVIWLAHRLHTTPLERVWARLRSATVGLRWATLMMRAIGAFLIVLALVQAFLTLVGSQALGPGSLAIGGGDGRSEALAALLDILAWLLVALAGQTILKGSRQADEWMNRMTTPRDPQRLHRIFGISLVVAGTVHLLTWLFAVPWPHRFSAVALLLSAVLWAANRPGVAGERLRRVFLRMLPETHGRGLWGSEARRRLVRRGVTAGDPTALLSGPTHLIIYACAIETGQMTYFINWSDPSPHFTESIRESVGEVVVMRTVEEVIEAVVASSAIPAVFEPVRIGDHEYVDGGVFSSQPLQAVLADGADAMVVVLVSPSEAPTQARVAPNLIELAGRLLEIAWWRDLQSGLRRLPRDWTWRAAPTESNVGAPMAAPAGAPVDEAPLRACVIEPHGILPGGLYGFSPENTAELRRLGEADAWRALADAGWLAPAPAHAAAAAPGASVSPPDAHAAAPEAHAPSAADETSSPATSAPSPPADPARA